MKATLTTNTRVARLLRIVKRLQGLSQTPASNLSKEAIFNMKYIVE
ncbi:MAG: hypothetical protein LBH74_07385 [Nitrososphaerota archaeon]|nr:hypothetical protein [Nitrososphaerota archaeon]